MALEITIKNITGSVLDFSEHDAPLDGEPLIISDAAIAAGNTSVCYSPAYKMQSSKLLYDYVLNDKAEIYIDGVLIPKLNALLWFTRLSVRNNGNIMLITSKDDFPAAVANVITLAKDTAYYIAGNIDLQGCSLSCAGTLSIIGTSSETSSLKSTGLNPAVPLISSSYTLSLQEITIKDVAIAFAILGNATTAFDWIGVNIVNVDEIGVINGCSNFIMDRCAIMDSANMQFTGNAGTIGFTNSIFIGDGSVNPIIDLDASLVVSRRVRFTNCSIIANVANSGIKIDALTSIPVESFKLDTVYFSGTGTFLDGITAADNRALFLDCIGILNSAEICNYYIQNNVAATPIAATNTPTKVVAATISGINQKFNHASNKATYTGAINKLFSVVAIASFETGNNNQVGFYIAKNGVVVNSSEMYATANGVGRAENISFMTPVELAANDYIEIFAENNTAVNDITVSFLNVMITAL